MSLKEYLKNKPIFYKKIDYEKMPRAYESIKDKIPLVDVVQIVGTNGKGSTGRFLAQILVSAGKSVGHYTSPHIFEFNERFYINGHIATDEELEKAHVFLQNSLADEFKKTLSYFEYATLLAAVVFKDCDFVIMEAGMGAEFDATSVYKKRLSLFTPIGKDHMGVLGNSLEEISDTKLISMQKYAILNDDMDKIPVKIAFDIAGENKTDLKFAHEYLNENLKRDIKNYVLRFSLPRFQISNLSLACAAAVFLGINFNLSDVKKLDIKGRMQKISSNITVDVGHNELAALSIINEFKGKKIVLIYNAFADKDVRKILQILKPIVKRVEILHYESFDRKLAQSQIVQILKEQNIKVSNFQSIRSDEEYLVFGSFMLVEKFLRLYLGKKN